jgi:hypothetical protein
MPNHAEELSLREMLTKAEITQKEIAVDILPFLQGGEDVKYSTY